MMNVKKAENHDSGKAVKPLEFQGFEACEPQPWEIPGAAAAAAGSRSSGSLDPEPDAITVAELLGVGATALLLTYGNLLMEALFRILGI